MFLFICLVNVFKVRVFIANIESCSMLKAMSFHTQPPHKDVLILHTHTHTQ